MFAKHPMRLLVVAAVALLATVPAQAFTYLVGAGGGACDYSTIQAAINGAASNPGPDVIRVARDQAYTAQALTIGTQDLTIVGGYASCAAALPEGALPSGLTVVSGQGGSSASVFTISGAGVRDLRNLGVQRGDPGANGAGGGIRFEGRGDLILRESVVSFNDAGFGGGVYFFGDGGGPAVLTIEAGTLITGNTAHESGGGVEIGGQARMFMLRDRSSIQGNQALGLQGQGGLGGGVLVVAPALVDIGSPGYNGSAALDGNTALRGGGLAAVTLPGGDDDVGARFFATDGARPVRVRGNRAAVSGGGIFLRPNRCGILSACDGAARLVMFTSQMDGNRAPDGAAIFGDYEAPALVFPLGSYVVLGRCPTDDPEFTCLDQTGFPETIAALGGQKNCQPGAPGCNSVDNNLAVDGNGVVTDGATIAAPKGAVWMGGMTIAGNTGGNAVGGYPGLVVITGSQLILNSLSSDLLRAEGTLYIYNSTVGGNVLGGATHVMRMSSDGYFTLKSSVVWQPGKLTLLYPGTPGSRVNIQYNVLSDNTTTPGLVNRQVDPRFNFPPSGDFRLRISSPALDYAPPLAGTDLDLDGRPHDQQVRPGPQRELVRDVGAFERQPGDPLLLNGRFDGSLLGWQNLLPAFATYSTQDAAGNASSGSVEVNVPTASIPAGVTRMTALTQCFGVPWPGNFRITAKAQTKLTEIVPFPDNVAIHWKLRAASLDCTGPIVSEGDRVIPNGSTGWLSPPTLAEVLVEPFVWNTQTSIEVQLDLLQNGGSPVASGLFGRIDDVQMTYADPVDLFRNGFE